MLTILHLTCCFLPHCVGMRDFKRYQETDTQLYATWLGTLRFSEFIHDRKLITHIHSHHSLSTKCSILGKLPGSHFGDSFWVQVTPCMDFSVISLSISFPPKFTSNLTLTICPLVMLTASPSNIASSSQQTFLKQNVLPSPHPQFPFSPFSIYFGRLTDVMWDMLFHLLFLHLICLITCSTCLMKSFSRNFSKSSRLLLSSHSLSIAPSSPMILPPCVCYTVLNCTLLCGRSIPYWNRAYADVSSNSSQGTAFIDFFPHQSSSIAYFLHWSGL